MDIVQWLIKHHSVDGILNKQDNYGNSPLHVAIMGGKKMLQIPMKIEFS